MNTSIIILYVCSYSYFYLVMFSIKILHILVKIEKHTTFVDLRDKIYIEDSDMTLL